MKTHSSRNTGTAYLLWLACFLSFNGIHRIYLKKYPSGVIYLFTFGILGIGQFLDLFFIPAMTAEANRRHQLVEDNLTVNVRQRLTPGRLYSPPIATKPGNPSQEILKILASGKGHSVAELVATTGYQSSKIQKTLTSLEVEDLVRAYIDDKGRIIYLIN